MKVFKKISAEEILQHAISYAIALTPLIQK